MNITDYFTSSVHNRVPEKQRIFQVSNALKHSVRKLNFRQNDPRPLYFRSPRSNLYLSESSKVFLFQCADILKALWFSGFAVGLLGVTYGAAQLVKVRKGFRSVQSNSELDLCQGKKTE